MAEIVRTAIGGLKKPVTTEQSIQGMTLDTIPQNLPPANRELLKLLILERNAQETPKENTEASDIPRG